MCCIYLYKSIGISFVACQRPFETETEIFKSRFNVRLGSSGGIPNWDIRYYSTRTQGTYCVWALVPLIPTRGIPRWDIPSQAYICVCILYINLILKCFLYVYYINIIQLYHMRLCQKEKNYNSILLSRDFVTHKIYSIFFQTKLLF